MVLLLIAALVAVGGIGFAVGHLTAGSSAAVANVNGRGTGGFNRPSLAAGQSFDPGQFGGGRVTGGLGGFASGVTGTVQSIDGTTMTIKLANGTTETIDLSGSTTYHNETAGSSSDVKVGGAVIVQIDTSALASEAPIPSASGGLGGRTLTAKDVLITTP
jgi:hypothetical protein